MSLGKKPDPKKGTAERVSPSEMHLKHSADCPAGKGGDLCDCGAVDAAEREPGAEG